MSGGHRGAFGLAASALLLVAGMILFVPVGGCRSPLRELLAGSDAACRDMSSGRLLLGFVVLGCAAVVYARYLVEVALHPDEPRAKGRDDL